jgi:hypothetical protein
MIEGALQGKTGSIADATRRPNPESDGRRNRVKAREVHPFDQERGIGFPPANRFHRLSRDLYFGRWKCDTQFGRGQGGG